MAVAVDWGGFPVCCDVYRFFHDDVTYVRDVEVFMQSMICYISGCICCGSENFGLGSLCDDCVGLAGTTPQFCSVAPYRFDCFLLLIVLFLLLCCSFVNLLFCC